MNSLHILILAIVSVFTGVIAPGVTAPGQADFPYLLTNMQYVSYGILGLLSFLLLFSVFHWRRLSLIVIAGLITLILVLGILTAMGMVKGFDGKILQYFSWAWFFLGIGLMLLLVSIIRDKQEPSDGLSHFFEKIIGITGFFVISFLSLVIIYIAEDSTRDKIPDERELSKMFKKEEIISEGNISLSPAFENISHFSYQRNQNRLSFIGKKDGKYMIYPSLREVENIDGIESIKYIHGDEYIVYNNGEIHKNGSIIGITPVPSELDKNFIFYRNAEKNLILLSEKGEMVIFGDFPIMEKIYYAEHSGDIYWKGRSDDGEVLYKNGNKISDTYASILRYAVANDDTITLIILGENGEKLVVRNGVIVHTIRDDYIAGTMQMNGNNVLYVIQNADDGSYSIVIDGVVSDRRLDEIREIFLEKNTSGYAYFGRPQGERQYCFFTRYRGNVCNFASYMNPQFEGDGSGVVFAGLRENRWAIYRNNSIFEKNIHYSKSQNIETDYFFFDNTSIKYFLLMIKNGDYYTFNRMGENIPGKWKDVDISSVMFGYNKKIFVTVEDESGWRILEIK